MGQFKGRQHSGPSTEGRGSRVGRSIRKQAGAESSILAEARGPNEDGWDKVPGAGSVAETDCRPPLEAGPPGQRGPCTPIAMAYPRPSLTHLLAHKEAGGHGQPVGEVVYGVGQQVEVAADLGKEGQGWAEPGRRA